MTQTATETTETVTFAPMVHEARTAMQALIAGLRDRYLERDQIVWSMAVAAVAGEHVLLLGPPGTAKSAMTNDFCGALGLRVFRQLIGKTMEPESLFGPVSIRALKDDRFERQVDGYLPTAQAAFLDEIFKGNSAILNALLTLLNERRYKQGNQDVEAPLEFCVGASNEMPEDGLEALFDRFMVRHMVSPLRGTTNFLAMMRNSRKEPAALPTLDDGTLHTLREATKLVDLSRVLGTIATLREELETDHSIVATDRRYVKALQLVVASAVLAGRTVATTNDLQILEHCLWDRPEDAAHVEAKLMGCRSARLTQMLALQKSAEELWIKIGNPDQLTSADVERVSSTQEQVEKIAQEVARMAGEAEPDEEADAFGIVDTVTIIEKDARRLVARLLGGMSL